MPASPKAGKTNGTTGEVLQRIEPPKGQFGPMVRTGASLRGAASHSAS